MSVRFTETLSACLCPTCGGANMHISDVWVHARDHEDGPGTVVSVSIEGGDEEPIMMAPAEVVTLRVASKDLPGRRSGLSIEMRCEDGCATVFLRIMQHKGSNLFWWSTSPTSDFGE